MIGAFQACRPVSAKLSARCRPSCLHTPDSDLGFSLEESRALLDLAAQRERDCGEIDALASRHLVEVDRKIAAVKQESKIAGGASSNGPQSFSVQASGIVFA
ncbi:MerR family DNA-binding protein [Novosphingobium sp. G106]|uniref:MerR family DNA-binding protein n=1 Tax=Novosphingobium sp. G106 TaxID=2849500 RepID=UPI0028121522|nr:MerR family DNA-binding protein [Novosphingobium sp. G106]